MFEIQPKAIYDDSSLVLGLGLTHETLARARREGRVRFTRQGRRVLYLGEWLLDWLATDTTARQGVKGREHAR
jgi:hypothetical protein